MKQNPAIEPTDEQVERLARRLAVNAHASDIGSRLDPGAVADLPATMAQPYMISTPEGAVRVIAASGAAPLWTFYRETARCALQHVAADQA